MTSDQTPRWRAVLVAVSFSCLLVGGCGDSGADPVAVALEEGGGLSGPDPAVAPQSWILPPISDLELDEGDVAEPAPPEPVEPEPTDPEDIPGLEASLSAMGERFEASQATAYGPYTQIVSVEGSTYRGSLVVEELQYPVRPAVAPDEFESSYQRSDSGFEVAVVAVEDAAVRIHVSTTDGRLVTLNMMLPQSNAEELYGDLFEYGVRVATPLLDG